ncbi:hypothetical protein H072_8722 [Dactylellina haptotyla CBS 200.50]|uniref:non-specific serine/threonine protein kinase n=1 Tax=Dactylellina haptotyla (strain CBS 200.50) TaxID=1284197 RepID=S8A8Y7_DACHA|nr:hypothetical protein H072_8722 [Dactylellina haptotyla CBS 200.50]
MTVDHESVRYEPLQAMDQPGLEVAPNTAPEKYTEPPPISSSPIPLYGEQVFRVKSVPDPQHPYTGHPQFNTLEPINRRDRICGLSKRVFIFTIVGVILLIAGAIGGAVGGVLASKNKTNSAAPPSTTPLPGTFAAVQATRSGSNGGGSITFLYQDYLSTGIYMWTQIPGVQDGNGNFINYGRLEGLKPEPRANSSIAAVQVPDDSNIFLFYIGNDGTLYDATGPSTGANWTTGSLASNTENNIKVSQGSGIAATWWGLKDGSGNYGLRVYYVEDSTNRIRELAFNSTQNPQWYITDETLEISSPTAKIAVAHLPPNGTNDLGETAHLFYQDPNGLLRHFPGYRGIWNQSYAQTIVTANLVDSSYLSASIYVNQTAGNLLRCYFLDRLSQLRILTGYGYSKILYPSFNGTGWDEFLILFGGIVNLREAHESRSDLDTTPCSIIFSALAPPIMAVRNLNGRDDKYEYVGALGQGGFGTVSKVRRTSDGVIMACKTIDCSHDPNILRFVSVEIQTWASFALSERYIANFSHDAAWIERTRTMKLYMKFYEGGDLKGVIDRCRHECQLVHPFMATYWAGEIARGIKACHDYKIIHRDIKPANVLLAMQYKFNDMLWALSNGEPLTESQISLAGEFSTWLENRPPWCHITDFGLGKLSSAAQVPEQYTVASFITGMLGTPGFMAPETVGENIRFSVKSDIYSLGCLLYNLCSSLPPPALTSSMETTSRLQIPPEYPRRLADVVSRCIDPNPDNRPNSRDVANEISEAQLDVFEDPRYELMRAKLSRAINSSRSHSPVNSLTDSDSIGIITDRVESLHVQDETFSDDLNIKLRDALFRANHGDMRIALAAGADANISALNPSQSTGVEFSQDFHLGLEKARQLSEQRGCDTSLLIFAIATGSLECTSILLANNALFKLEDQRENPLLVAAAYNQSGIVKFLVEMWNFDQDYRIPNSGYTALWVAASKAFKDVVKTLLYLKAMPFIATDDGDTPIHALCTAIALAPVSSIKDCLTLILDSAPYLVNMCNKPGNTPLHSLLLSGSAETGAAVLSVIELLVHRGADPDIENNEQKTVFEVCESRGYGTCRESIAARLNSAEPIVFATSAHLPRRNRHDGYERYL